MKVLILLHMCLALVVATVNGKVFKQCEGIASHAYIAGQSGCRSFIFCNGASSYESTCPIDSAFNPLDGTCDDPANVDCQDEFVQPTPAESKIACPSEDDIIYLPSPESCENYYMCYGGVPIALTCSKNLHFNTQKQSCDFPKLAQCKLSGNTGSTQSTTAIFTTRPSPTKIGSPAPTIVSKTTPPLPASTTFSTATTTRKTPPQSTTTPTRKTPSQPKTTTAATRKTPPQSIATTILQPSKTSPQPTTITTPKTSPQPTTTTSDIGPPIPGTLSSEELCKQHWVGNFPFPEDCHFYYRCMNGLLSKQECPSGFGWDGSKKMCSKSGCSVASN